MAAVFHGNEELCRALDERVIVAVVRALAGRGPGQRAPLRAPHYLELLAGLCRVGDAVISRNQARAAPHYLTIIFPFCLTVIRII